MKHTLVVDAEDELIILDLLGRLLEDPDNQDLQFITEGRQAPGVRGAILCVVRVADSTTPQGDAAGIQAIHPA